MNNTKKILLIAGLAVDVGVTIFLFIISVMILAKVIPAATINEAIANTRPNSLIRFLLQNPTIYLVAFVIPLFVLLAGNVVGLIIYVKKTSGKSGGPAQLDDLSEEQKEALRQELLKDLGAGKEEPKPEPKEDEKQ